MSAKEQALKIADILLADTLNSGGEESLELALQELNKEGGVEMVGRVLSEYTDMENGFDSRFLDLGKESGLNISVGLIYTALKEQIKAYLDLGEKDKAEFRRVRNIQ